MGFLDSFHAKRKALDEKITKGWLGRFYEMEQRSTTFGQELRAGIVGFLTVVYIVPVNSAILTDTGGSCDPQYACTPEAYAQLGAACRFTDPGFAECMVAFRNDLISSTCIAAMISTFLMSIFARMPLAVAPAMGVNAYFTYNVVGFLGTKYVTYKQALAAVFVEGWIFIAISVTGVRGRLVELIPRHIMYSTAAGIGCFLAFIGLQSAEGIALINYDGATLVTLGACPPDERARMFTIRTDELTYDNVCAKDGDFWSGQQALGPPSANYACLGKQLQSATTWLGIATGILIVLLFMKGVKGSILIGILFCTFISWIPGHGASYLGAGSPIPGGERRMTYFRKGVTAPSVDMTGGQLDFSALGTSELWVALITFLYLDFLDATSTMFAMARLVAENVPGFVNERGQWPRQLQTMLVDGIAIVIGSTLGTSPLTVFAESAVAIREGGRTGVTSMIIALGFGLCMFFAPIFSSIPPYATGPAIVTVGALMMEHSRYVHWDNMRQASSAFLTMLLMPLTYSIAYGVIGGLGFAIALWLMDFVWETIMVLCGAYKGTKTMRHVWLDTMSHFYVSFNKEDVLIRELPGYVPIDVAHGSGSDSPKEKSVAKLEDQAITDDARV